MLFSKGRSTIGFLCAQYFFSSLDTIRSTFIKFAELEGSLNPDLRSPNQMSLKNKQKAKQLLRTAQQKLDQLPDTPVFETDDKLRRHLMKAYLLFCKARHIIINEPSNTPKAKDLLSQSETELMNCEVTLENAQKMVFLYAAIELERSRKSMVENNSFHLLHLRQAQHVIDTFCKIQSLEDAWTASQIFDIQNGLITGDVAKYLEVYALKTVAEVIALYFIDHLVESDPNICFTFGFVTLKQSYKEYQHHSTTAEKLVTIRYWISIISRAMALGCYRQTTHLLGVAIFQVIKLRYKTKSSILMEQIDYCQGQLSLALASYGGVIAAKSLSIIRGQVSEKEVMETICNSVCYEGTSLYEVGVEYYLNQFPDEPVQTIEEVKSILEVAIAWNKRGIYILSKIKFDKMEVAEKMLKEMNKLLIGLNE